MDYALSGLPDFDQKQNEWHSPYDKWTYCGPVAAANSLWWFDSKFEPDPVPPPTINDGYALVEAYEAWDDHDVSNAMPLVEELAKYFSTDSITGTNIYSMYYGIRSYLYDQGLDDDYLVTLAVSPTIGWVTDEAVRGEDVILLLGFWQEVSLKPPEWERVGGHYVTVAGVAPSNSLIALSDPFVDMAEQGAPGRVLSGTLTLPHTPGHDASVHNDAGNVSHDFYTMTLDSPSPGGVWWLPDYPSEDLAKNFEGVNPHPDHPTSELDPSFKLHTEVEFAIAVSRIFEIYVPLSMKRY
jgi:hypothetical protein